MKKINSFDVLKTLAEQNVPSFKLFPSGNVTDLRVGKDGWGKVTFALDNATVQKLLNDTMGTKQTIAAVVLVWDVADFEHVKSELETRVNVELREALADYAHHAWSGWMDYLFSKGIFHDDGTWTMPKEFADRWRRQASTFYVDLPDSEKESDRKEADKMLDILGCYGTPDKE